MHPGNSKLALFCLAALWSFAEATLFFIAPDALLSIIALRSLRKAMVAALLASFAPRSAVCWSGPAHSIFRKKRFRCCCWCPGFPDQHLKWPGSCCRQACSRDCSGSLQRHPLQGSFGRSGLCLDPRTIAFSCLAGGAATKVCPCRLHFLVSVPTCRRPSQRQEKARPLPCGLAICLCQLFSHRGLVSGHRPSSHL